MKVSLVVTVLNEEKTIEALLASIACQTLSPDEVIVVDGGSTDWTVERLQQDNLKLRVFIEEGANRARGRNIGVDHVANEIIAFTDAGCTLDKNWLKRITQLLVDPKVEAVAGYYRSVGKTVFEKCVTPYALVMPDKVNPQTFLPASRSMAIRKEAFWRVGGFPERFSDNEDFVFANRLKKEGVNIVFQKGAIVNWFPRSNLKGFWTMIYRFSRGDARVSLRRLKVLSIFLRYFLFFELVFSGTGSFPGSNVPVGGCFWPLSSLVSGEKLSLCSRLAGLSLAAGFAADSRRGGHGRNARGYLLSFER
jgi:glycosyltransferase involved in cell wall biosynthesis